MPMMVVPSNACVCVVPMEVLSADVPFLTRYCSELFEFEIRREAKDVADGSYYYSSSSKGCRE